MNAVLKGHIKALDENDTYHIREALRRAFQAFFLYFKCDFLDGGNGGLYTDPNEIQKKFGLKDIDTVVEIYFFVPAVSYKVIDEQSLGLDVLNVVKSVARKDGLQPLKFRRVTNGGNDSWVQYGIVLTPIK